MGFINQRGAEWWKWDLHVHTPASLVHHFKGTSDMEVWEKYISDLEGLPAEFKVIGINDYLFLDGYRKVLEYKKGGRLQNLDLILPVIEFRLKKFAGHKQFKRINFHVIFSDEVSPDLIQNQFLNTLTGEYHLTPGIDKSMWNGAVTTDSLVDLGNKIKASVPAEQLPHYGSDLEEGFNNLNLDEKSVIERLVSSTYFKGKYLFAIGKTEWDALPWTDGSIAEKKDVINKAHLVFTASENVAAFNNAKGKLTEQKVNNLLLDCSDSHHNIGSSDKDRIGNCFTWIKADRTFDGLKQIVNEPERVFIGDMPEINLRVNSNKTKYIESLKIDRVDDYKLQEEWFNATEINFNHELVAIIGNKGNGKSAIADIIGLLGNTKNGEYFSFLNNSKFRKASPNRAVSFNATLTWASGDIDMVNLNDRVNPSAYEKVKYIPQNFLEKLCNDNETDFERELRKVIFTHVSDTDKLNQSSLEDLIKYKTEIVNERIALIKSDISETNSIIIELEKSNSPINRKTIAENLKAKEAELAAHKTSKPSEVSEPTASEEIQSQQQGYFTQLNNLKADLLLVEQEIKEKNELKLKLNIELNDLQKFQQSSTLFSQQYEKLKNDYRDNLRKYGLEVEGIVKLTIDSNPVSARIGAISTGIAAINLLFDTNNADNLPSKKINLSNQIKELQTKLDAPSKLYQEYLETLKNWQAKEIELVGKEDVEGSIKYLESQLKYIDEKLRLDIEEAKKIRLDKLRELHKAKCEIINEYKKLYQPVTKFISQYNNLTTNYPISVDVSLNLSGFKEKFFNYVSQGAKGSYYGREEGYNRLVSQIEGVNFNDEEAVTFFLNTIITSLEFDQRESFKDEPREIVNQIRKDFYSDFYEYLFGIDYLVPNYELKLDNKNVSELSPGEKGALLLIFYLLLDQDDIPLIIDQPEENLDNQSVYKILVPFVKEAKKRRQIIIVTHNPNLAVVCDAEQVINVRIDKADANKVHVATGAIENLMINNKLVEILEGTLPAFNNRDLKYSITKENK
ncbi:MAG: AAA family ATPase [Chitinophagaceae bacterium]|jgi:ABC-type lipoprotein export system ATPase subunit|nr:AAA family ATPase [Ferruginibacter sp.]HMP20342.1 AAA family ATPase [Ferruginibacter sp.]